MKKLEKTLKSLEEKPHGSLKRNKLCKFSKNGEHDFVLVKPHYADWHDKYKKLTVDEYYKLSDQEDEEHHWRRSFGKIRYYECSLCGKKKLSYIK